MSSFILLKMWLLIMMLMNVILYLAEDMLGGYDVAEHYLSSFLRYGCWLWCCRVPFLLEDFMLQLTFIDICDKLCWVK